MSSGAIGAGMRSSLDEGDEGRESMPPKSGPHYHSQGPGGVSTPIGAHANRVRTPYTPRLTHTRHRRTIPVDRPGRRRYREVSADMKYGFSIPNRGPNASPENLATLVGKAEEWGYHCGSTGDHIVVPANIGSRLSIYRGRRIPRLLIRRVDGADHPPGISSGHHPEAAACHWGDNSAPSQSPARRQGPCYPGRPVPGPACGGYRGGLDEGGVPGAGPASLRGTWGSNRRVHPGLQGAVDQRQPHLRGEVLPLLRHLLPAQARPEASPTHMGRRRESPGPSDAQRSWPTAGIPSDRTPISPWVPPSSWLRV